MKKENAGKVPAWQIKLGELAYRADGINPVNGGSWERLQGRLNRKTPAVRFAQYWPAAACIILIFLLRPVSSVHRTSISVPGTYPVSVTGMLPGHWHVKPPARDSLNLKSRNRQLIDSAVGPFKNFIPCTVKKQATVIPGN